MPKQSRGFLSGMESVIVDNIAHASIPLANLFGFLIQKLNIWNTFSLCEFMIYGFQRKKVEKKQVVFRIQLLGWSG
jgi:hypothetical protein